MAIVRSAATKVKIKEFFFTAAAGTTIDVAPAVRDTMLLFGVDEAGPWPGGTPSAELKAGSVLITGTVNCDEQLVSVTITVSFRTPGTEPEVLTKSRCWPLPPAPAKSTDNEDVTGLVKRLVRLAVVELMRKLTGENPVPWGILRGVRPTKLVHRYLDQGLTYRQVTAKLVQDYAVQPAKADLITGIAIHQRPVISNPENRRRMKNVSVYVGIPYCPSRCLYCSFPAFVLPEQRDRLEAFLQAIIRDINSAIDIVQKFKLSVESIYIGGGTPTSLAAADLAGLLELIKHGFQGINTSEFIVEAGRPDSLNDEKIDVLRQYGVNRVSINPQTMQDKTLKQIGRQHTVQDIIDIFAKIRQAGIPVINMDVIAGLPGESAADLADTMHQIARLNPENITLHTLALKRGSKLMDSVYAGALSRHNLPNEKTTQAMLAIAADYIAQIGMHPYYLYRQKHMTGNLENIGYAKPATDCLYNIQIMEERQTIIGIGPAAGTKAVSSGPWRLQSSYNAKDVPAYIKNLDIYLHTRNTLLSRLYGDCKED
ncbi:coproporphyrinogen dehydrogenase HemZ [Sporomusa termitida]|uniref:tRNA-2-methylthio-N(6)-dimethylallyladenosine synthase n=1 Tax=Sporomusa termitida TaxID=2377 RepID=A0A517DU09_9FIRM|nr:coproporphyrinogen dehydrogenase HemZ [Sporomusa termitida]QDR80842.1 tRNA-2-methylthio-N(6)-dimethylallyladenosine synthase [Sporomusa termitida]